MYVFSMITRLEGHVINALPPHISLQNCLDLKVNSFANLGANTLKIGSFTNLDLTNLIVNSFFQ